MNGNRIAGIDPASVADAAIVAKWFGRPPPHFQRYAIRRYGLDRLAVADVGCAYGSALQHFGRGSYGVELNPEAAAWARAHGLDVHCGDMERIAAPAVDAVWCCDVFEHVDSPHLFLRAIARILRPEGLAFITVPLMSPLRRLAPRQRHLRGWAAADHVNFFTPATLRATIAYAGFEIAEMTMGKGRFLDAVGMWAAPECVVVARKIAGWDYARKSSRCLTHGRKDMPLRDIGYADPPPG